MKKGKNQTRNPAEDISIDIDLLIKKIIIKLIHKQAKALRQEGLQLHKFAQNSLGFAWHNLRLQIAFCLE